MNSLSSSLMKNQRVYAIVGIVMMIVSTIISPLATLSVSADSESTDPLKDELESNGIKEDTKVIIVLPNDETKEVTGEELYEIVSGEKEYSEEDVPLKIKGFQVLNSIKEKHMSLNGVVSKKEGKKYVFLDYDLEEHYDESIEKYRTCPPLRITSSVISLSTAKGATGPPAMGVSPDVGDFEESKSYIGAPGYLVTPQGNILYDNYYGKEEMDITVKIRTHEKHNVPEGVDGLREVRELDLYVFGVNEDETTKEIVKFEKTSENNQEITYNVTLDKETLNSIERNELLIDYRGVRDRSYDSHKFLYGIHMDLFVNKYDIDSKEKENYHVVGEEGESCVQVTKSSGGVDNAFGNPGAPGPIYVDYDSLDFNKYVIDSKSPVKYDFELEYTKGKNVMDKLNKVDFYAENKENELLSSLLQENNSSSSAKKAFIMMSEGNPAATIRSKHKEKYNELNERMKELCGEKCSIDYPYNDNKEEIRIKVIFEGIMELIEENEMDGYENLRMLRNINDGYTLSTTFFYSIKSFKEKENKDYQAFFIKKDNEEKHYTDEDKYSIIKLEDGQKYVFDETETKLYSPKQKKWMDGVYKGHTSRNYEELALVNIPKLNFNIEKLWKDNKGEEIQPGTKEVTVEVFNEENKVSEVVLSEDNNWNAQIDLPMYFLEKENSSLKEIKDYIDNSEKANYTFKEKDVEGFTSTVTSENDSIIVTNIKNVCTDFKVISEDEDSNVVITDENGEIFAEGKIKEGEFSSGKPLVNGKKYKVEISKDGYISKSYEVIGEDYSCEFEAEKLIEYTCSEFTIKSKDEGAKVVIIDEKGDVFAEGLVNEGKFNSSKPLTPGEKYFIEISKDGFIKEVHDVIGSKDECLLEAPSLKENVCTDFTVKVNENNAQVKITDKEGNLFAEGLSKDGKFISNKPLTPGDEYILTVSKDGFETEVINLIGEKLNCEVTVTMKTKPTPPVIKPEVCENFTVVLKGEETKNAKITIKDEKGNVFAELTSNDKGEAKTGKPLVPGSKYTVIVEKDGYKTVTKEIKGNEEVCTTEISIEKEKEPTPPVKPEVCENFTVKVNGENAKNAKVTIKDEEGNIFFEGVINEEEKIQTEKPLTSEKEYTITVEKDGYKTITKTVTGNEETCETEVSIEKEEEPTPPVKPETCESFTVKVLGENSVNVKVTVKDSEGGIFFEGITNEKGEVQTEKPLTVDEDYTITVEKDGYKTASKIVTGNEETCETEVSIEKEEEPTPPIKPETCESFTVKVEGKNVENAKVVIKDKDGNIHSEGVIKNGKFTGGPLEEGKEYTVTVSKSGYYTATSKVTGENILCEVEVELNKRPSGGGSSKPNYCDSFTVTSNVDGAKVLIKKEDRTVQSGYIKDGAYSGDPLVKGERYTVIVSKEGYETKEIHVLGDNELCLVSIDLEEIVENEKPNKPEGEKPNKPEGEKPNKPEGEKPNKPEGEKPNKPEGEKPNKPEGEKPNKPEGEKPSKPEGEKPSKPEGEKPSKPEESTGKLPQTNTAGSILLFPVGMIMLILSSVLLFRRKQ